MEAPKIPSFFKNVKTSPRKFNFRSPYYKPMNDKLKDVKDRVDQETARAAGETGDYRRQISFNKKTKKQIRTSHYKWAMLRTVLIGIALVYILYRGILWAETTNFSTILDTIKDA